MSCTALQRKRPAGKPTGRFRNEVPGTGLLLTEDFDFDIVVHGVGAIAGAPEAEVLAFGTFGVDVAAFVGFNVGGLFADPEPGRVVVVVVVDGFDAVNEIRVVGDLDDHVVVGAGLGVEVPDEDPEDLGGFFQVNLHPLFLGGEFYEVALFAVLVTVGDEFKVADDREIVRTSDFLAKSNVLGSFWHEDFSAFGSLLFQVREALDGFGRTDENRARDFNFQGYLIGSGCGTHKQGEGDAPEEDWFCNVHWMDGLGLGD